MFMMVWIVLPLVQELLLVDRHRQIRSDSNLNVWYIRFLFSFLNRCSSVRLTIFPLPKFGWNSQKISWWFWVLFNFFYIDNVTAWNLVFGIGNSAWSLRYHEYRALNVCVSYEKRIRTQILLLKIASRLVYIHDVSL